MRPAIRRFPFADRPRKSRMKADFRERKAAPGNRAKNPGAGPLEPVIIL
ncbi:hypothetical protein B4135_1054 [Caldibacillus debilis]|uniref:Uncharacterized protein n=1 Tax=Caldibacillus debilis TaxID=301148 RepID=A0A150MEA6_9BACI|nr:hypothetical protein B4135_1054 [Caldibacillus debilis]